MKTLIKRKMITVVKMVIVLLGVLLLESCYISKERLEVQEITSPPVQLPEVQKIIADPLVLETKDGHQVHFNDVSEEWAVVKEKLNTSFERRTLKLAVYRTSNIDLKELAQKDKITQHYKVYFPEMSMRLSH